MLPTASQGKAANPSIALQVLDPLLSAEGMGSSCMRSKMLSLTGQEINNCSSTVGCLAEANKLYSVSH